MATLTDSLQTSAAAAAESTHLISYAQTAGRLLALLVRGSANASATISNVFDDAGGQFTTTAITDQTHFVFGTPGWTTNQWAGYILTCVTSGDPNFRLSRSIVSNDSTTITLSSAFPNNETSGGSNFVIGNVWTAVSGQSWTADGGAGTSHIQWWYANNILAASTNANTVHVIWGGGNTANTLTSCQFSGFDTANPISGAAAANGTGTTPTCGNISPSVSGILLGGYGCPTTAQTFSNALDNAAGNTMTINQPSGTQRAAVASLTKSGGGTWAPRITQSTSEGWVAIPVFVNDVAAAGGQPTVRRLGLTRYAASLAPIGPKGVTVMELPKAA